MSFSIFASLIFARTSHMTYSITQPLVIIFTISNTGTNVIAVPWEFGHIYWRNPLWKTSFFVLLQLSTEVPGRKDANCGSIK